MLKNIIERSLKCEIARTGCRYDPKGSRTALGLPGGRITVLAGERIRAGARGFGS